MAGYGSRRPMSRSSPRLREPAPKSSPRLALPVNAPVVKRASQKHLALSVVSSVVLSVAWLRKALAGLSLGTVLGTAFSKGSVA